jgi:hypothetical protein
VLRLGRLKKLLETCDDLVALTERTLHATVDREHQIRSGNR